MKIKKLKVTYSTTRESLGDPSFDNSGHTEGLEGTEGLGFVQASGLRSKEFKI